MSGATRSLYRQPGKATASEVVRMNVSGTKYTVVSLVAESLGMVPVEEDSGDCEVYWIDSGVPLEKFLELKHYQRINHFPGTGEICRKDSLARNLQRMRKKHRDEYSFAPLSWVLPGEYSHLCYYMQEMKKRRRSKTFIVKPPNGAMGNGIMLTRSLESIPQHESLVVQEYLEKPFLLDGFKCDLRVYVLMTACNPLRIFVYKDGLVRLSTQHYTPPTDTNLDQCFMHLTNYSVNKHSESFDNDESEDKGSKRTLKYFNGWLQQNGYNAVELWARIHDVIIKTVILAHSHLVHSYQACRPGRGPEDKCQCFEILGFDILLDHNLKPWLLEVNRSPSFGTDSQLDLDIKCGVIRDALRLVNIQPSDKKRGITAQKAASRRRLLYTPPRPQISPYNFLGEQEAAAYRIEKRKGEVKERLMQIRRQKEQEAHEEANIGGYVRIFPTPDPHKTMLYTSLLQDSAKLSLLRKTSSPQRVAISSDVQRLKEHELLDLLSQYEEECPGASASPYSGSSHRLSTSVNPLVAAQASCTTPMEAVYAVMAAREQEEEKTQRTMIALNEMKPFYPGKSSEDVQRVLEEVNSDMKFHRPNIASFWLVSLDNAKRKQLLTPVREAVKGLLHCYWRTANLEPVRLLHITNRLFSFLLSRNGQGLWTSFASLDLGKSWETTFKQSSEVISVTEMVCCRRTVELCQCIVISGYYYHHLHKPQRLPSGVPKCPSLPSVKPKPALTTQPQQRSRSYTGIPSTPFRPATVHKRWSTHRI